MQETLAENELFESKKGAFYHWLSSISASPKIWEKRTNSHDALKGLDKHKTIIEPKTIIKVCVVSILVGHTTFLISVLDSFISFNALEPKFVIEIKPSPMINNNKTPRTLYKKAISTK